ncbi:MAG: ribose 5-phosphate isomerase B [Acidobacteriota bacterium]|nr:ribose 5-phosphate isomerase B [Acidobacteriota bacterium]
MRIAIGSDHAGFELKEHLAAWLRERGHDVDDAGTHSAESVDYPEFAHAVGSSVASGTADLGVLVCGTGIGTDIAANKVRGVRCARCLSEFDARFARAHNDANLLSLGARVTGSGLAEAIVETFLSTGFDGGRHARRVSQIEPVS